MPSAEPVAAWSRRHAAGASSARGLLFTVLGEFALPGGGSAWTSALIDVMGRLGVEQKACRQALMRTAAGGWLAAERRGRRTRWSLTPAAERLLTEGTERIYGFGRAARDWDGRWLLVLARAPEAGRPARHLLRTRLSWAGLGSPAPGVWIGPHSERAAEVQQVLDEAGLGDAQMFHATRAGGGPLAAMVAAAWDLASIESAYQDFLTEFGPRDTSQDHIHPTGNSPPTRNFSPAGAFLPARSNRHTGSSSLTGGGSSTGIGSPTGIDSPRERGSGSPGGRSPGDGDPLAQLAGLVHAWRRFPFLDPELPAGLLPAPWSGTDAARLFTRLHARWAAPAAAEWQRLNDADG